MNKLTPLKPVPSLIAVLITCIIWFAVPVPDGVDPNAWHLLALFVGTIAAIIGKAMPIGAVSMVAIALVALTGVTNPGSAKAALADALSGFSNELIWLIGVSIMVSLSLNKTGLGARIGYYFISLFGKKTLGIAYSLAIAETVLAPVTPSNTARGGGIIHPIMRSIADSFGSKADDGTSGKIGRYLALVNYFVEQRGAQPHFYDEEYEKRGKTSYWHTYGPAWMVKDKPYSQAHQPISEQQTAIGHAVRFVYLMTGVAHLARLSQDEGKRQDCLRLWKNMAQRQLYITGGIGSQSSGEAFSSDYDLPNDSVYAESCASIGLMMFARRMLEMEADSKYADVMERALYNTVLGGMALDGKHFFYVNPLEVHPKSLKFNHIYDHVKPVRQRWFGCACCPPNIARVLTSIGHYLYTPRQDALYINMYVGNSMEVPVANGSLKLRISGDYPWHEQVKIAIESPQSVYHTLALRLPDWCSAPQVLLNGQPVEQDIRKGYLHISRTWQEGDTLSLTLPMPVRRVYGNPLVRHVAGKVAIQRGPLVYCLEQADNGEELHNLWLPKESEFRVFEGKGLFSHKMLIQAEGVKQSRADATQQSLWHYDVSPASRQAHTLTFIPWFSWANRGEGEMRIWVNER